MIFESDINLPLGRVRLPDSSWVVSDRGQDRGCVSQITKDGRTRRVIAKIGRPMGSSWIKTASSGQLTLHPGLLPLTMDEHVEVFLTDCSGEALMFPDDLTF